MTKNRNEYAKYINILFYLAWAVLLINRIAIGMTEFTILYDLESILKYSYILVIILLFTKIVISRYTRVEYILLILIGGVVLLNLYLTRNTSILTLFSVVVAAKGIDFRRFIGYDIIIKTSILVTIVSLCIMEVIPNYSALINMNYKYSMGFIHPNTLGMFGTSIMLEYFYYRFDRLNIADLLIVIGSVIALYLVTKARTSIYSVVIIMLIYFVYRHKFRKNIPRYMKVAFMLLPMIAVIISFYIVYSYSKGNPLSIKVNELLTNRLRLTQYFIDTYHYSIFGKQITIIGTRKALLLGVRAEILDMGYIRLVLENGWLLLLAVLSALTYIQYKSIKYRKYNLLLCSSYYIILGIAESHVSIPYINFTLIAIIALINEISINNRDNGYKEIVNSPTIL